MTTLKLFSGNLKIVCMSSGIGSCRSKNNFGAEKLWHDRTENEDVRHVMHMDKIVAARQGFEAR